LLVETRHNAVTVPSAAVQLGPQGVYAYVVKADSTVQMVPIKVSPANAGGDMALIESGVSAGDQVVTDGQLKLRPGVTVKVIAAAPAAAPATAPPAGSPSATPAAAPVAPPAASAPAPP